MGLVHACPVYLPLYLRIKLSIYAIWKSSIGIGPDLVHLLGLSSSLSFLVLTRVSASLNTSLTIYVFRVG